MIVAFDYKFSDICKSISIQDDTGIGYYLLLDLMNGIEVETDEDRNKLLTYKNWFLKTYRIPFNKTAGKVALEAYNTE